MKLAVITSPDGFGLLEEFRLSYHLLLAQHCTDGAYLEYYKHLRAKGDFLILDNGAAELGESMDFARVLEHAAVLDVDEIAMPDVLGNSDETLKLFLQYCPYVPERRRMAIPQGRNFDEWTTCLNEMLIAGCRSIGVAKRYEQWVGGRAQLLEYLEVIDAHRSYDVHLLGCYKRPSDELTGLNRAFPWIRGADTAAPFAYAQAGVNIYLGEHVSHDWYGEFDAGLARTNIYNLLKDIQT